MALSRFVVTAAVTVPAGAAAGGTAGSASTPDTAWSELWPVTFLPGQVIVADSSAGSTGPQLLYQALAASIRPYVQGQDDRGGAALSN